MNRLKEHSIYLEEMGKEISHCDLLGTGQGTIGEMVDIEGQLLTSTENYRGS